MRTSGGENGTNQEWEFVKFYFLAEVVRGCYKTVHRLVLYSLQCNGLGWQIMPSTHGRTSCNEL